MYTLVSAIGVKFGINKNWDTVDAAGIPVVTLFRNYRKVWLVLRLAASATKLYLSLEQFRTMYATYTGTVPSILTSLGDASLPTTTSVKIIQRRSARFHDLFKMGYSFTPVTVANSDNASTPDLNKTHLRITRELPVTDYSLFTKKCLVSVNGFFHLTDTDGINGAVVTDAMKSLRHSRQNQIGMLSFANVADIDCVPITPQMVQQTDAGHPVVTIPKTLDGKTVLLVLGGYLHTPDDNVFSRVGTSAYRINFSNLPMVERHYESSRYLDLSTLPLQRSPANDTQINLADLTTDAFILAYLRLSQSFFVIVNCEELYTQKQYVKRTGMPNMYISYVKPMFPLVTQYGRFPEYWSTEESGQYSVTVYDNAIANSVYSSSDLDKLNSIDAARVAQERSNPSRAYFLEIARDI